jgi:hypothetical protein
MLIAHRAPAAVDRRLFYRLLDGARAFGRLRRCDHGRRNDDGFAAHNGMRISRRNRSLALQSQALDWCAALRPQFIVARSLVHDDRFVVGNVGDIGRLIHNGDVLLCGDDHARDSLLADFSRRDKTILVWPDVVVVVGPIVDTAGAIEVRFRRQRRPADVLPAFAP